MERKLLTGALAMLLLLLLGGCTGNLFMEIDRPEVPSFADMQAKAVSDPEEFLQDVDDYLDGKAITEENADDVVTALKEVYDPDSGTAPDSATEQEAALKIAEISLLENEDSSDFVNNVSGALSQVESLDTEQDAVDMINSLVPDSVMNDPTAFTEMINSLVTSGESYLALGEGLETYDYSSDYMEAGELGDTAQRAAITVAVIAVLDSFDGTMGNLESGDTIDTGDIDTLYDLVNGGSWDSINYADPTEIFGETPPLEYAGLDDLLGLANLSL
jgi:hypothetical protein